MISISVIPANRDRLVRRVRCGSRTYEHTQSQRLLVLNGDSYIDISLKRFDRWHVARESKSCGSLLLTWTDEPSRFGTVDVGPGAKITAFREKCTTRVAGWINAGVYFLARPLVESIDPERNTSLEPRCFLFGLERGIGGFTGPRPADRHRHA